jgi:hypothetical protein
MPDEGRGLLFSWQRVEMEEGWRWHTLKHFHRSLNAGIVLSHPSRKNKDAARVGHPDFFLTQEREGQTVSLIRGRG